MIKINAEASIDFSNMGLFICDGEWMHPIANNKTYELIYVVSGSVYLNAGENVVLNEGELYCLPPNVEHRGYKKSENVSFFWLHFFAENYERFGFFKKQITDKYNCLSFFKKLNHLASSHVDKLLIESMLLTFLLEQKIAFGSQNKLFYDLSEYIRVNADNALKVSAVASKFGYNADYLSKLCIKSCGLPLKKLIDRERSAFVSDKLLNTNLSLKEIAELAGFDDDNALIKFFLRTAGCSPSNYRNLNYATHTNKK